MHTRTDLIAQFPYLRLHRHRFSYAHKSMKINTASRTCRESASSVIENGNQLFGRKRFNDKELIKNETCEKRREQE